MIPLQFYSLQGEPLATPQEWQAAWLLLENLDPERERLEVSRQNQLLTLHKQQLNGQWQWLASWTPCSAGHYALRINGATQHLSVLPSKISPAAFSQLLLDLTQNLAPAIALSLQNSGAWAGLNFAPRQTNSLAEALHRVRRAIDGDTKIRGLRHLFPQLARQPLHRLQRQSQWRKRELAHRPLSQQWAQQLKASNLDVQQRPLQVLNQNEIITLDVPENHFVKFYLDLLAQQVRRLQAVAITQSATWQAQVQVFADFLHQAQHSAFLQSVRLPTQLPQHYSQALLRQPIYRAVLDNYLHYQRSLSTHIDLHWPELDAPLENLPKLYQLWCSLQVMLCTLDMAAELGYQIRRQNLCRRRQNAWYVQLLPHGQSLLELEQTRTGKIARLLTERSYSAESVSFLQRPDVALEIQQAATQNIYLFDAKYKLDSNAKRPQKLDIDKMHAYRDAIRPHGKPAVRYAAILYPGELQHYDAGLQALPADPACPELLREALKTVLREALS